MKEKLYKASLAVIDDRMKEQMKGNKSARSITNDLQPPHDFKPYFFVDALLNITEGTYTWYRGREGPVIELSEWINVPNFHPYQPNVEKWIFLHSYCDGGPWIPGDGEKNSSCLKYVFLTYTNCLTPERAKHFNCQKKQYFCESDLKTVHDGKVSKSFEPYGLYRMIWADDSYGP